MRRASVELAAIACGQRLLRSRQQKLQQQVEQLLAQTSAQITTNGSNWIDPACPNKEPEQAWRPCVMAAVSAKAEARENMVKEQVAQQQQAELAAQTSEQLKKLKPSPSDVVGTFEVQGQGVSSYSGTGPTHTDCNLNYNTVDCTSRAAQYSIETLHISGIFHVRGMDYVLRVVPFSHRCAFAQGMVAGGGGHAAACGASLYPGIYVAKLSAGRLRVVGADGKRKADYTVVEQSIQR